MDKYESQGKGMGVLSYLEDNEDSDSEDISGAGLGDDSMHPVHDGV